MSPVVRLLHGAVTYNFERLKRVVAGLSQEQIDYRGKTCDSNSIAQLLRHLAVVDLHWVYRLQSKDVPLDLYEHFGPMYDSDGKLPRIHNVPLHVLLAGYAKVQDMLLELCRTFADSDLSKIVPFENGNSATVRWGIWHVADHGRHHQAHIKKLIQEWGDKT
ncbi:MAG: DinB family protein [Alicyclobacillus sp.]|nr:DinB family protein [Alicyclobacillus sp.]